MKLLLVEDESDLRELIARGLERRCHVPVVQAESGNEAITLLSRDPEIGIVVSDYNMRDGSGGDLFRYMERAGIRIPFILCSSHPASVYPEFAGREIAGTILKPDVMNPLIALVERFASGGEVIDADARALFLPVALETIAKFSPLCCSLYIQLSEDKYVKVMKEGDLFGTDDVERFRKKKDVDSLYIRTEDCALFVASLARATLSVEELARDLQTPEAILRLADIIQDKSVRDDLSSIAVMLKVCQIGAVRSEQTMEGLASLHSRISGHIERLGFSPQVQALSKASVALVVHSISHTRGLAEVLRKLNSDPESYLSGHSVYLAHISCAIASLMSWSSDASRYKLALAAMLHDVTLGEDRLARIRVLGEKEMNELKPEEASRILEHPKKVTELMKRSDDILSYNVDQIVMQHHERPDGSGFPNRLTASKIAPLAAVFIVGHDLVDCLLEQKDRFSLKGFLNQYADQYKGGAFRKIAAALGKLET